MWSYPLALLNFESVESKLVAWWVVEEGRSNYLMCFALGGPLACELHYRHPPKSCFPFSFFLFFKNGHRLPPWLGMSPELYSELELQESGHEIRPYLRCHLTVFWIDQFRACCAVWYNNLCALSFFSDTRPHWLLTCYYLAAAILWISVMAFF